MGFLLTASRIYLPGFIRRQKIIQLFEITAAAFEHPLPILVGFSPEECLRQFAIFTRDGAQNAIERREELSLKSRLYQATFQLGQKLRGDFKIRSIKEPMEMSEIIYKILGIDLKGDRTGNILIARCFFSHYYSGEVCRVISSLDEGLLAGLSGGLQLNFSRRITEGSDCCQARLAQKRVLR